jgi:hypothetical protein
MHFPSSKNPGFPGGPGNVVLPGNFLPSFPPPFIPGGFGGPLPMFGVGPPLGGMLHLNCLYFILYGVRSHSCPCSYALLLYSLCSTSKWPTASSSQWSTTTSSGSTTSSSAWPRPFPGSRPVLPEADYGGPAPYGHHSMGRQDMPSSRRQARSRALGCMQFVVFNFIWRTERCFYFNWLIFFFLNARRAAWSLDGNASLRTDRWRPLASASMPTPKVHCVHWGC